MNRQRLQTGIAIQGFDYDELIAAVEKARASGDEPCWVVAKSLEHAEAFAAWCVENGIEEPEIRVLKT